MAYEIIRFTLADPHLEQLKSAVSEKESIHTAAKRLLQESLDNGQDSLPNDKLQTIEERLTSIENRLEVIDSGSQKIDEDTVRQLEAKFAIDYAPIHQIETLHRRIDQLERSLKKQPEKAANARGATKPENSKGTTRKTPTQSDSPTQSESPQVPSDPSGSTEGLTSQELANHFGVHRSQISRWEKKGDLRLADWEKREDGKWYLANN